MCVLDATQQWELWRTLPNTGVHMQPICISLLTAINRQMSQKGIINYIKTGNLTEKMIFSKIKFFRWTMKKASWKLPPSLQRNAHRSLLCEEPGWTLGSRGHNVLPIFVPLLSPASQQRWGTVLSPGPDLPNLTGRKEINLS